MTDPKAPAYPNIDSLEDGQVFTQHIGFTKRELFAKDILCALLSNSLYAGCPSSYLCDNAIVITDKLFKRLNDPT